MTDFPDFITWAGLEELREVASDDELTAHFRRLYELWKSRKAWHEFVQSVLNEILPNHGQYHFEWEGDNETPSHPS